MTKPFNKHRQQTAASTAQAQGPTGSDPDTDLVGRRSRPQPAGFIGLLVATFIFHVIHRLPAKISGGMAILLITAGLVTVPLIATTPGLEVGMVQQLGKSNGETVMMSVVSPFEAAVHYVRVPAALATHMGIDQDAWILARGTAASDVFGEYLNAADVQVLSLPMLPGLAVGTGAALPVLPDLAWIIFGATLLLVPGTLTRIGVGLALALCAVFVTWHGAALLALNGNIQLPWFALPTLMITAALLGFAIGMSSLGAVGEALRRLAGAGVIYLAAPALSAALGWPSALIWVLVPLSLLMPVAAPVFLATLMFSNGLRTDTGVGVYAVLGACAFIGIALNTIRHTMSDVPAGLRPNQWQGRVPLSSVIKS